MTGKLDVIKFGTCAVLALVGIGLLARKVIFKRYLPDTFRVRAVARFVLDPRDHKLIFN